MKKKSVSVYKVKKTILKISVSCWESACGVFEGCIVR
jgi:hypothetical protein